MLILGFFGLLLFIIYLLFIYLFIYFFYKHMSLWKCAYFPIGFASKCGCKNKKIFFSSSSSPPVSLCSFALSPSHRNFVRLRRRRESISLHHQRGKNSGSVITLSRAIKPLPRSDRWPMLEGLFIFCLLIRAGRRGREHRGGGGEAGMEGGRVRKRRGEEEGGEGWG